MPAPRLRITRLHLRDLGPIRSLDLPEDGLGWEGNEVPDTVVIGGANGSGKTTLLDFIANVLNLLAGGGGTPYPNFQAVGEAVIDFDVLGGNEQGGTIRFVAGEGEFVQNWWGHTSFGYSANKRDWHVPTFNELPLRLAAHLRSSAESSFPSVLYMPSERRNLLIPNEQFKSAGRLQLLDEFYYQWRPPETWKDSLEALLYAARWADLNAKEEGHPEKATNFQAYAQAFEELTQGTKSLVWERGELMIEVRDSGQRIRHELDKLSSGEKQVLVLSAELLRRWRPGSLVLIDEPELHLHTEFQVLLWEMLLRFQQQRGGQLIIATQSPQIFSMAEPGTTMLLKGVPLP